MVTLCPGPSCRRGNVKHGLPRHCTWSRPRACLCGDRDTGLHVPLLSPHQGHKSARPSAFNHPHLPALVSPSPCPRLLICACTLLSIPSLPLSHPSCCHFGVDLHRFGGTGGHSSTQNAPSGSSFGPRGGDSRALWSGRGQPRAGGRTLDIFCFFFFPPIPVHGLFQTLTTPSQTQKHPFSSRTGLLHQGPSGTPPPLRHCCSPCTLWAGGARPCRQGCHGKWHGGDTD